MPTITAKPMVVGVKPTLASQKVMVAAIRVKGKPLEMPRRKVDHRILAQIRTERGDCERDDDQPGEDTARKSENG